MHPGYVKTQISGIALINGRLTPEQSAENIFSFLESDYKTGSFWDSEAGTELPCHYFIYQGCFTVIYVCNNCDVFDFHTAIFLRGCKSSVSDLIITQYIE